MFRFARAHLSILLLAAATLAQAQPAAPPVKPVTEDLFGTRVTDPYRYFENLKDPEVAALIRAQADYTRTVLDKIPLRQPLLQEITRYGDAGVARVLNIRRNGDSVYFFKRLPDDNIPKLYVRTGTGPDRLLVVPDLYATSKDVHAAIDWFSPSPDNKFVAFGISTGGSEESVLQVKDVASGRDTGEAITRANFGPPGWTGDGRLLYNRLQVTPEGAPPATKFLNSRVYLHRIGEDPDQDVAVLGTGLTPSVTMDPAAIPFVTVAPGSTRAVGLVVNGVQNEITLYLAPVESVLAGRPTWTRVVEPADQVTDFAVDRDVLYLLTHKDASRYKVLRLPMATADIGRAQVVLPAGEGVITGISAASDGLYLRRMNGSTSELLRLAYGAAPGRPLSIPLPYAADIPSMATDPRVPGVIFETSGWTRFGGVYAYDPRMRRVRDTGLQPQGIYDNPTDLVSTEVKVRSHDGTLVPLSIVHRKGLKLDGSNPTIVYGYGAYGVSQTPFYRPTFLPWFQRGGVLAVAHVRGGGEYGEDWHKAGYKLTKPNTWKDAIASGRWLVEHGYTSSARMSIMGGSAGGIFVGRSITEEPELFGAAIDQVPVSDALRIEFSANGPPNIPEFGSVTTEEGFRGLYAMSSYHWIKDGVKYPAVLVTSGWNDPRVDTWQAAKMAARLQAATASGKPVLLRIDYDAGHGIGSTKKQSYEERADVFAFLLWQAGLTAP